MGWSYEPHPQWPQIRRAILKRDKHTCYNCGQPATEVDHKTPISQGGTNHPTNLAAICTPCHRTKTQQEATQARRHLYALRKRPPENHPGAPPPPQSPRNSGGA